MQTRQPFVSKSRNLGNEHRMKITNCGSGVHAREVAGVQKLQSLPAKWFAYTNLDLIFSINKTREIDVVLVAPDRVLLIDFKDWRGPIWSSNGSWMNDRSNLGASPVPKLLENVRSLHPLLKTHFTKNGAGAKPIVPFVQGLVVITSDADFSRIDENERKLVCHIDEFVRSIVDPVRRNSRFGTVPHFSESNPFTEDPWRQRLMSFFNAGSGQVAPGMRTYGNFSAQSEAATFVHRGEIFSEYDAIDKKSPRTLGTLRLWDFSKADARFQNEDGRNQIAGREREVYGYIKDVSPDAEAAILNPLAEDPDRSVRHWEVFDRRRGLRRFREWLRIEGATLPRDEKIEISRQILSRISHLHDVSISHQDIGPHSIWVERPSQVKISHLMTARYRELQTLGANRFQFLSSALSPEDFFGLEDSSGATKDVYLAAGLIHQLLFGSEPIQEKPLEPGQWNPSVDPQRHYVELHSWFESCLSLEPSARYPDANQALSAFNRNTEAKPTKAEVFAGLERFGAHFKSQKSFISAYPSSVDIKDSIAVDIWKSGQDDDARFVKLWKTANWGSVDKIGTRLLSSLQYAEEIKLRRPEACVPIIDIAWLGDAIGIVQPFLTAPTLHELMTSSSGLVIDCKRAVRFSLALCKIVSQFHEEGFAHGDIKPSNILVTSDPIDCPKLVDVIEFAPVQDGVMRTERYSPAIGGKLERDRFAVGKIVEELLSPFCEVEHDLKRVLGAVEACRSAAPVNATIAPLVEALEAYLKAETAAASQVLTIVLRNSETHPFEADEGCYFIRLDQKQPGFFIRGLYEEIAVDCTEAGEPIAGRRRSIDQSKIYRIAKHEFMSMNGEIIVRSGSASDCSELKMVTTSFEFIDVWKNRSARVQTEIAEPDGEAEVGGDESLDVLVSKSINLDHIKLPKLPSVEPLWRALIDAESQLITKGTALSESSFHRDSSRHVLAFELEAGTFDFNDSDSVGVECLDRNGRWRRIGSLDVQRSTPELIVIENGSLHVSSSSTVLVSTGQVLKFTSHFEEQSRKRRTSAVDRIINGQAGIPNLIEAFGQGSGFAITQSLIEPTNKDLARYGLNAAQASAFKKVLGCRPLGAVQGPPGTGKTKFIAALVHFALKRGIVSNVLLASQSHEAVNNATEAVLRLFSEDDQTPSLLRVGNDAVVSESLRPFHSEKLEQLCKDRFKAQFRYRVETAAASLGIPTKVLDFFIDLEEKVRPLLTQYLKRAVSSDTIVSTSAQNSLASALSIWNFSIPTEISDQHSVTGVLDSFISEYNMREPFEGRASPEALRRLRQLAELCHDFLSTVSTARRSFEPFLAGTREIVSGTCVGLGRPSLGLTNTYFDLVIVDEAARCTASELAVPIQSARWAVLVGDQRQLEPTHPESVVDTVSKITGIDVQEVLRSDFERLFETPASERVCSALDTQYRMLAPIGSAISSAFYDGMLFNGREDHVLPPHILPEELSSPIAWIETDSLGTSGYQSSAKGSKSLRNVKEADVIEAILKRLNSKEEFVEFVRSQSDREHVIGIICMYSEQKDLIRRRLATLDICSELKQTIKLDTVDGYQGKENAMVIVSLVRNNHGGNPTSSGTIQQGFLAKPNRINVAMSRAMDRLVVVGARARWPKGSPLEKFSTAIRAQEANAQAASWDARDFLSARQ